MSTEPDPKAVREIARTFLTDPDADELKYVVRSYIGYAGGAEHEAWCDAVRADAEKATVTTTASWPDEQQQDDAARIYPDSHSPWSQWLTSQLLDRGWLASDLVKASGNVLTAKQVSRWLHSQEVPEPGSAAVAGKAFGGVVIGALHAAGHGDVADGLTGEAEQPQDETEQLRKQHAATLETTAKAVAMLSDTYRERAFLVALLAAEYPSVWAPDPSAGPDWRVVYVDLPTGQASWHISPDDWDLFGFVPQGDVGIWDGHTTVEKYKRVFDLTMNIHLRKMTAEQPQDDGEPCAVCYCCGCSQCVNSTPPSEVCFCMKAMRPGPVVPTTGQPQDERDAQLADLATELDATNDNADEIADRAGKYREEIMRLRTERNEARELACVSLDILKNVSDEPMRELYDVNDFGEMPDWFTGYGKPSGVPEARDAMAGE